MLVDDLHRYANVFTGKHSIGPMGTAMQMGRFAAAFGGRQLPYAELTAAGGVTSGEPW